MQLYRFILLVIAATAVQSFADPYDLNKVVAVQDRAYSVKKDISAHLGILPLDAFNKTLIAGASYTYSWKPQWSWEILNASFATNLATSLKKDLADNWNVRPVGLLDQATGMATTQLLYSPLYGKYLLFNEKVVHNELSFGLSAGTIQYKYAGSVPVVGVGIMSRYFRNEDSSFKFDARLLYQATNTQSSNLVLYFTLGYSVHLDVKKGNAN